MPLLAAMIVLAGCGVGRDAVTVGGDFTFVAPGGQTRIFYDPPEQRGAVTGLSGESLLEPGSQIELDEFAGQVVVLNIWGAWCGPCREEMPGLQLIYEQTRASGVRLLGIDIRDDRDAAADFVRDRGITYPSIYDQPVVLDRAHRVAAVFLAAVRAGELMPVVQRVAAEPTNGPGS